MNVLKQARVVLLVLLLACVSAGCGSEAPSPGADRRYTFVAPGGQDRILYDPPDARGQVAGLSGRTSSTRPER